jgi:hypothetical protein
MQKGTKKITIMGLLANCSTDEARALLKNYGYPDAKNKTDLEVQLAKLYKDTDDKRQLEKDFAEIHPHKNFIGKYIFETPKTEKTVVETVEEISTAPIPAIMPEYKSGVDESKSCSCGCSNMDGNANVGSTSGGKTENDKIIIYSMFGIVSILALVLINKNK